MKELKVIASLFVVVLLPAMFINAMRAQQNAALSPKTNMEQMQAEMDQLQRQERLLRTAVTACDLPYLLIFGRHEVER